MADLIVETSEELSSFLKKEEVISELYKNKYKPSKKLKATFRRAREALFELTGLLANTRQTPLGRTHGFKGPKGMSPPEVHYITDNNLTLVADIGVHEDATNIEKKLAIKRLKKALSDVQAKLPINKKRQNKHSSSQKKKEINEEIDLIRIINLIDIIRTSDKCKKAIQKQRRRLFHQFRNIWLEAPGEAWSPYRKRFMSICLATLREGINDFLINLYDTVGSLDLANPKPKDFGKYLENGIGSNIQLNWNDHEIAISGWLGMGEPIDEGLMRFQVDKNLGTLDFEDEKINTLASIFENVTARPATQDDRALMDTLSGCRDILFEDTGTEKEEDSIRNYNMRNLEFYTDGSNDTHTHNGAVRFEGADAFGSLQGNCPPDPLTYQWYYLEDASELVDTNGDGIIDETEIPGTAIAINTGEETATMAGGAIASGFKLTFVNQLDGGTRLAWADEPNNGMPAQGSIFILTIECNGVIFGPYTTEVFIQPPTVLGDPEDEDRAPGPDTNPPGNDPWPWSVGGPLSWVSADHCGGDPSCIAEISSDLHGEYTTYDSYMQCLTIAGRLSAMDTPASAGAIGATATYRTDLRLIRIYEIIGEEAAYLYRYDAGDWQALATNSQLEKLNNVLGHDYPDRHIIV